MPPLTIIGDVETVLNVPNLEEAGHVKKIRLESGLFRGVSLKELLSKAKPQNAGKIYIVANDGFTAALDANSLEESYITFSPKNGWELINLRHPKSSNVKMIQEIIVVAGKSPQTNSFTVISGTKTLNTTVGKMYTRVLTSYPYFEGRASLEHGGKNYKSEIYTRRRAFKMKDLLPLEDSAQMMLFGGKGDCLLADDGGFYQLVGNRIDYIHPEEREKLEDVRFVVIDPPAKGIADVYDDVQHYLENGENVLMLLLEGVDYGQYEAAIKEGRMSFLRKKGVVSPALGFYPFETRLWLEAILTGVTPSQNSVEKDGKPKTETLFDLCKTLGKPAILLGNEMILDIDEQVVVKDGNANSSIDDEIYKELKNKIPEGYGLVIANFHPFKPFSSKKVKDASGGESLGKIDSYIQELASLWSGKIIVTALPSSNEEEDKKYSAEKLFIPYMLLNTN